MTNIEKLVSSYLPIFTADVLPDRDCDAAWRQTLKALSVMTPGERRDLSILGGSLARLAARKTQLRKAKI